MRHWIDEREISAMSLRIPTEEDYERFEKACKQNDVAVVKALLKEAAVDLSREYDFQRVSGDGLHASPLDWI